VQTIVVGVDGSDPARRALEWAVAEARLRRARLRVVYAHPGLPAFEQVTETEERARRDAELIVQAELASTGIEGVEVECSTPLGPAVHALLEASKDADLLVVGSRGRHGFPGLLLGSVSQQVAHHALCPVVIVPRDRSPQ
jgi:nucleotide-binding universal stress UspA family protein